MGRVTAPVVAALIVAALAVHALAGDPPPPLVGGVPVERAIAGGEQHAYELRVNDRDSLKLTVDQLGADVAVDVAVGGRTVLTADEAEKHHYGRELLVWSARESGTVVVTIRAKSTVASGGRYRLAASFYDPTETIDMAIVSLNDAFRLFANRKRETAKDAAAALERAVAAWRQIGDSEVVANCLVKLAYLDFHDLLLPDDGVPISGEAAAIYEAMGLETELTESLGTLSFSLRQGGQAERALETLERSYGHAAAIDPVNRAMIEDDIAIVEMDAGDLDRAAVFAERAASTFGGEGEHVEEFLALERLALIYSRLQRGDDALRAITRAIELGRIYGTPVDVASLTLTFGRIAMAAGDDDAALAAYRDALPLFNGEPRRFVAMLSIGRIYNRIGDSAGARPILEAALAQVPQQLREYWAAIASELGVALTRLHEPAAAVELQQKALEIVRASRSRVGELAVLRDIVPAYRALGDLGAANAAVDRADEVNRGGSGSAYAPLFLRERARNAIAAGDLDAARTHLDEAIRIVESVRGQLQSQALRATFGATAADYFADAMDVAMAMHAASPGAGHDARAFELFERSRARSLGDLLAEARANVKAGVNPALIEAQGGLQRQLGAKDAALRDMAANPRTKAHVAALEREIADIEHRLAVVDAQIRASSPRYAELAHPVPVSLGAAQRLLDDRTVLIAIDLGRDASWAWAITRSDIRSVKLPAADQIEQRARRVYDDITARQKPSVRGTDRPVADAERALTRDAAALSDELFGPLAAELDGAWRGKRLAIVAGGALEYVSFAALPAPRRAGSAARDPRWLVDDHEFVRLPSVSVLAQLRSDVAARPASAPHVAVLADAVYSADDPRVRAGPKPVGPASATRGQARDEVESLTRGVEGGGRAGFARLVFSREEATAIATLARARGAFEALDFEANVRTFESAQVANARIVHVASHGILNTARPELSGLVLSLVDRRGRPTDGVLHLYDILNLKLSADLVVLSGCQTGLGRQMRGEGLVGLSRAFMYAGAPRIVASLWQVDDLATAELMRRFYRGMLVEKRTPAAALAAAQREMRRDPRWHSPYYWAAFTLIGDWR